MHFTGKRYLDYTSFIKSKFGERVQKISLDIGFSCPNRDGSKGFGGCTYCNNEIHGYSLNNSILCSKFFHTRETLGI